MTHRSRTIQDIFFYSLLLAVFVLVVGIFGPYLSALALAAALAVVLQGVQSRLTALFRGRNGLAAFVTILFSLVIIGLPVSFIVYQVFKESRELYTDITSNPSHYTSLVSTFFNSFVKPYFPDAQLDVSTYLKQASGWIISHFGEVFSGTAQFVVNLLLCLIALFYFLRDGEKFQATLIEYSPLPDKHDLEIIGRLNRAVHSVLRGSVFISLIQGTLSGIGFWMFGVPNPALWGSVAAISALIPGVGTSLVLIPATAYLFLTGQTVSGVGMLLWSVLAVGLIDNLLAPYLVGRGAQVHPLLVLFSVLGGIGVFGPLGFIFGPLTVSLLLALLGIYRTYFNGHRRAS